MSTRRTIVVGITGASGAIYGVRLAQRLLQFGHTVHLLISDAAWIVFEQELGWDTSNREVILDTHFRSYGHVLYHTSREFTAPVASGSYRTDGMIIAPCSMGTLSSIANGASRNLMERTADVMLKERRKFVLVPRETPLNQIHLQNMLQLVQLGAHVVPAMPGFYHRPQSMDDLVHFVVGKALDAFHIDHELFRRWGE